MPLTSGTRLGPYEIQSPVGAGGMGEVYRARDTPDERIIGWHGDSNNLLLADPAGADIEVYNLNLATGARTLWLSLSPAEKAGIRSKDILFTPDGSRFAYVVRKINSNLFVADGLR
jgi:serine/threonine protein kinase